MSTSILPSVTDMHPVKRELLDLYHSLSLAMPTGIDQTGRVDVTNRTLVASYEKHDGSARYTLALTATDMNDDPIPFRDFRLDIDRRSNDDLIQAVRGVVAVGNLLACKLAVGGEIEAAVLGMDPVDAWTKVVDRLREVV